MLKTERAKLARWVGHCAPFVKDIGTPLNWRPNDREVTRGWPKAFAKETTPARTGKDAAMPGEIPLPPTRPMYVHVLDSRDKCADKHCDRETE
jgi:hypothetical protein